MFEKITIQNNVKLNRNLCFSIFKCLCVIYADFKIGLLKANYKIKSNWVIEIVEKLKNYNQHHHKGYLKKLFLVKGKNF